MIKLKHQIHKYMTDLSDYKKIGVVLKNRQVLDEHHTFICLYQMVQTVERRHTNDYFWQCLFYRQDSGGNRLAEAIVPPVQDSVSWHDAIRIGSVCHCSQHTARSVAVMLHVWYTITFSVRLSLANFLLFSLLKYTLWCQVQGQHQGQGYNQGLSFMFTSFLPSLLLPSSWWQNRHCLIFAPFKSFNMMH